MAIIPENITTIRVDQLSDETLTLDSKFPHTVGTDLKSSTIQELVDFVATALGVSGGVGYLPISVTDGQQLPDVPELPSFFLCGAGTYLNVNGFADVICTGQLNAVMSLVDHWTVAVQIPIAVTTGVATVTGDLVDNTDPVNPVVLTPTLQGVSDVDNVVTYPAETTFAKYKTATDVFAQIVSDDDGFVNFEVQQSIGEKTSYQVGVIEHESAGGNYGYTFPFREGQIDVTGIDAEISNFTAKNNNKYVTDATLIVTDPTGVSGRGYIIFVNQGTTTIGGVGYTAGALVYRFYDGSVWTSTDMNASSGGVSDGNKGDITVSSSGTVWTIDNGVVSDAKIATGIDAAKLADGSVSNTELQYINSLSSNAQTQINSKQATLTFDTVPTNGSTNPVESNGVFDALALKLDVAAGSNYRLVASDGSGNRGNVSAITAAKALKSDANGIPVHFDTSTEPSLTELAYIKGLTSAIQAQLDAKQVKIIKSGYLSATGATSQTVITSLLIPAGWIASGDGIEIALVPIKSTTAAVVNFNIYHDTSVNGTTNALATGAQLSTSQRMGYIQRILSLDSTTLRNCLPVASSALVPIAATGTPPTTTFNPAVDNYITITANPSVGSETYGINQFYIRKL